MQPPSMEVKPICFKVKQAPLFTNTKYRIPKNLKTG